MKRQLAAILFCLLFLFVFPLLSFAQNAGKIDVVKYFDENKRWYNDYTEHWFYFSDIPDDEIRSSIIQWERIGADLETAKEEWAGTFANGDDTHGDYFRWSEKNGFIWLNVNKCQGGPMRIIRGSIVAESNQIKLFPEHITGTLHSSHMDNQNFEPIELLFVKWRNVPYLIRKKDIADFADYTAGLGEYNGNLQFMVYSHLQKVGVKEDESNNCPPIFPTGYEKFVKKPIRGQIISIGKTFRRTDPDNDDWENLVTRVRLDIGKADGSVPNLGLFLVDSELPQEEIKIKTVNFNSSLAEIIRQVRKKNCVVNEYHDCENFEYVTIKVGMKLSTTVFDIKYSGLQN